MEKVNKLLKYVPTENIAELNNLVYTITKLSILIRNPAETN